MPKPDHDVSEWYKKYYEIKGSDRNDLLRNPEVLFQALSYEASIIGALRSMNLSLESTTILDVGCGGGRSTEIFLQMGFEPGNIYGIDILEDRIQNAIKKYPNVRFQQGDASRMPFEPDKFDLVGESTMFVQIIDDDLARGIAAEMIRVTKPGGYLMLADCRYNKPGHPEYKALTKKRLATLFDLGSTCHLCEIFKGSIIPPIGRFVSKRIPGIYFLLHGLLPFLVGQVTYVLQKR